MFASLKALHFKFKNTRLMDRFIKVVFQLFIFFLPTQLGRHFWPDWSYIYGIKIDYLSPTIYFTDILLFLILLLWILRKKSRKRKKLLGSTALLVALFVFLIANIYFAQYPVVAILKWLKIAELVFIILFVLKEEKFNIKEWVIKPLSISLVLFSSIAFVQILSQRTIGGPLFLLGERSFTSATPGIAKFNLLGQEYMRPYSTFPHPNAMAGFMAVSLFILLYSGNKQLKQNAFLRLSLLLTVSAVVVSISHGAWISFAIVGLLLLLTRKKRKLYKRLYVFVFTLTIVISLLLPVLLDNLHIDSLRYEEEVHKRLSLARVAGLMTAEKPIVGIGANNFILELAKRGDAPLVFWWFQPVHNIFLLVSAETGLIGLFAFAATLCLVAKKGLFQKRTKILSIALLLIVLTGFIDHYWLTLQQSQLLLAIIVGLSLKN